MAPFFSSAREFCENSCPWPAFVPNVVSQAQVKKAGQSDIVLRSTVRVCGKWKNSVPVAVVYIEMMSTRVLFKPFVRLLH